MFSIRYMLSFLGKDMAKKVRQCSKSRTVNVIKVY